MTIEGISAVGVVGAGLMGAGLAQEFARGGYDVWIHDASSEMLASAPKRMRVALEMMAGLGMIEAGEVEPTLRRVRSTGELADLAYGSGFVVEAVSENLDVKKRVFAALDRYCAPDVVLASNTSALSPTALGEATKRPDKVVVTHYFNPPYLLPAVEIVPGAKTSKGTLDLARRLCESIGKQPVVMEREIVGFVINRLQYALFREATWLVENGYVSAEDLDRVVVGSLGNRLAVFGPFKIADLGGLDVYDSICDTVFPALSGGRESPSLMRNLVAEGKLGAKSGAGFYGWPSGGPEEARRRLAEHAAMMFAKGAKA